MLSFKPFRGTYEEQLCFPRSPIKHIRKICCSQARQKDANTYVPDSHHLPNEGTVNYKKGEDAKTYVCTGIQA